jgi:hypothetical protein
MITNCIYPDNIIELSEEQIFFRNYYIPIGSKHVKLSDVDIVEVYKPEERTGRWRISRKKGFRTWFVSDWQRPVRDRVFILYLKNKWRRIGFTVEEPEPVIKFFWERGMLRQVREESQQLDRV